MNKTEKETPKRNRLSCYRKDIRVVKQMTKIFVFLEKDWEDRGTGSVYFILKNNNKYYKLNDYDMDRLEFNNPKSVLRHRRKLERERELTLMNQNLEREEIQTQQNNQLGLEQGVLPINSELEPTQGNDISVVDSALSERQEDVSCLGAKDVINDFENEVDDGEMANVNKKKKNISMAKLKQVYMELETDTGGGSIISESDYIYNEIGSDEEINYLENLNLGIKLERTNKKPKTGDLFILILKTDDNNLPKRPDTDLNETLKGEFKDNEDVLMWYDLNNIFMMDSPYNNIIEWQHQSEEKLKLAISFLSYVRCEESYHAISKIIGIPAEENLTIIEPGCNLEHKLAEMHSESVENETLKTAYMNPTSRYLRGLHREFCFSLYYNKTERLAQLGEIFKFFVSLSDMDIMMNMLSDSNHVMFFTCLNFLPENIEKDLNFENYFRSKVGMINVLDIKEEEIIVTINSRFRLIFLKDFVFSVSLNEDTLQHYNLFLIMNGTAVIKHLNDKMADLFGNVDELINRNVDQMSNFFGEFFSTIKHHFLQFEELKINFSIQFVNLDLWKKLTSLILKNLVIADKLQNYLNNLKKSNNCKTSYSTKEISQPHDNDNFPEDDKKKCLNTSGECASMFNSFVSGNNELKSVKGDDVMEFEVSQSVRFDKVRKGKDHHFKLKDKALRKLEKAKKKILLSLEVLSFVIKHNNQSSETIFFDKIYEDKCLADGIFELSSFPSLSIRETFYEIFSFFVHFMENKESFIDFMNEKFMPYCEVTLKKNIYKFGYFEKNGFNNFLKAAKKKERCKLAKNPNNLSLTRNNKPTGMDKLKEMFSVGLQKKLDYRQFEGYESRNLFKKVSEDSLKEFNQSVKSQEDSDPISKGLEDSMMSEQRFDAKPLNKRSFDEYKEKETKCNSQIQKDQGKFKREKREMMLFMSFYLGIHEILDKLGEANNSDRERKKRLFMDCKGGLLLIDDKSTRIYFLKMILETLMKNNVAEGIEIPESFFDEALILEFLLLMEKNLRKNSMTSCILKGIFEKFKDLNLKDIRKTILETLENENKRRIENKKPILNMWKSVKSLIEMAKKEPEEIFQREEIVEPEEPALITETNKNFMKMLDSFNEHPNRNNGQKQMTISDSLIGGEYLDDEGSSDENENMYTNSLQENNGDMFRNSNSRNPFPDSRDLNNIMGQEENLEIQKKNYLDDQNINRDNLNLFQPNKNRNQSGSESNNNYDDHDEWIQEGNMVLKEYPKKKVIIESQKESQLVNEKNNVLKINLKKN